MAIKNIEKDKLLRYFIKIGTPFNNPTIIYKKETVGSNRFDTKLKIGEDTKFVLNVLETVILYMWLSRYFYIEDMLIIQQITIIMTPYLLM